MLAFFSCTLLLVFCPGANARWKPPPLPPSTRTGTIEKIDQQSHLFVIREEDGDLIKFQWNAETKFIADQKQVNSTLLKIGELVTVQYRSSLFEDRTSTKVIWKSPGRQHRAVPKAQAA